MPDPARGVISDTAELGVLTKGGNQDCGAIVIAIGTAAHFYCNPDALQPLVADSDLVLIGDADAESRLIERYGRTRRQNGRAFPITKTSDWRRAIHDRNQAFGRPLLLPSRL